MIAVDRRMILRSIGATLAAGSGLALAARARAVSASIVVPQRSFVLRRELERGLAHGDSLLVVREWRARFEQSERGTLVEGSQVSCTVDAPAVLEPIAAIERDRIEAGPFPARLDMNGRIIDDRSVARGAGAGDAVQAAFAVLERLGTPNAEMREAREYLGRLAEASGRIISAIPPDLFFPVVGEASERRELALPDGTMGEVSVKIAVRAGAGGLLESFDRRIVTRIGDDTRNSRETWRLRLA